MSDPFSAQNSSLTLSVSQLNRRVRTLLESHFDFIWVEGEVSNFAAPASGHWYFSLKDDGAQVRCAMFRNRNQRLRFTPGNGAAIRLRARVSLYEARGEFQLIVEHLEHAGTGALQIAFEKLKAKLLAEGLFAASRKKPVPHSVSHLGVITSPSGAAIHDILTVLRRRCPGIAVSVLPVAVQGTAAAAQIARAIENANRWQRDGRVQFDALIVGRGGGSLEDLWAFNEEVVARAIAASALPVVSAVGHEVDFTIADMAADHRAATPSAAAELLSPDQRELQQGLRNLAGDLMRLLRRKLAGAAAELTYLRRRLRHPGALLREQAQRLDDLEQRLTRTQRTVLTRHQAGLHLLHSRLRAHSPLPRVRHLQRDADTHAVQLQAAMRQRLQAADRRLAHLARVLDSLSPLGTLQRGYAIITDNQGKVLRDAHNAAVGDEVRARLARGLLGLTINEVD
ncbi:MAG: exodeoxyribonuclease VII large subunit [Halioglobus sp.]|nr:exodeoxyribonuclease VII large subunit [Halioglobus sp.]